MKDTPKGWPWNGRIEFRNCYMKYTPEDLPVLKNLNLVIESGWKVRKFEHKFCLFLFANPIE